MPAPFIPVTRARNKAYITLYAIRGGAYFDSPAAFASGLPAGSKFSVIGAVEKVETQQDRGSSSYRELYATTGGTYGAPVEIMPQLPHFPLPLAIRAARLTLLRPSCLRLNIVYVVRPVMHQADPRCLALDLQKGSTAA